MGSRRSLLDPHRAAESPRNLSPCALADQAKPTPVSPTPHRPYGCERNLWMIDDAFESCDAQAPQATQMQVKAAADRRKRELAMLESKTVEPISGSKGATDPGPRNPELDRQNPDILTPPETDNGSLPNMKSSFGIGLLTDVDLREGSSWRRVNGSRRSVREPTGRPGKGVWSPKGDYLPVRDRPLMSKPEVPQN